MPNWKMGWKYEYLYLSRWGMRWGWIREMGNILRGIRSRLFKNAYLNTQYHACHVLKVIHKSFSDIYAYKFPGCSITPGSWSPKGNIFISFLICCFKYAWKSYSIIIHCLSFFNVVLEDCESLPVEIDVPLGFFRLLNVFCWVLL